MNPLFPCLKIIEIRGVKAAFACILKHSFDLVGEMNFDAGMTQGVNELFQGPVESGFVSGSDVELDKVGQNLGPRQDGAKFVETSQGFLQMLFGVLEFVFVQVDQAPEPVPLGSHQV